MIYCNPYPIPEPTEKPSLEHILYWVTEREIIRVFKQAGVTPPWTADPILQKYRFCNVSRRDDRVSQWLLDHWYSQTLNPAEDVWFNACVARYINWPPTLNYLIEQGLWYRDVVEEYDPKEMISALKAWESQGQKVWSAAYLLFPGGMQRMKASKIDVVVLDYLTPLISQAGRIRAVLEENSIERLVNYLAQQYGFGQFMGGQVAADLTYLAGQLNHAVDLYTYAPMGPGSIRGFNRLHDRPLEKGLHEKSFLNFLTDLRLFLLTKTRIVDLTLHDVQNIMCEMDKYWRVLYGEGRPRANYKPETRY